MDNSGLFIARISELESQRAELLAALKALWQETILSGNSIAKDYGWPKARELTLAALARAEKP